MSQRLLALESATDWLSVAFFDGAELVGLFEADGRRRHAAATMPLVERGLAEVGWTLDTLEAIAVSAGPGSFTSLRIGLATAKGLAFGRDWTAVGVSTLEAMALGAAEDGAGGAGSADAEPVLALLDARRGEWYAGAWRAPGTPAAEVVLPEGLYGPEALVADLPGPVRLVCPEPGDGRSTLEAAGLRLVDAIEGEAARPRADRVGRLGRTLLAAGQGEPVEALSARYLRRAQAEAQRLGAPVEAGEIARIGEGER